VKRRSEFERSDDLVQLIACGVPVHSGGIFVFGRAPSRKATAYGTATLWTGCHVRTEAKASLSIVKARLRERVESDLHLLETAFDLELIGLAWDEAAEPRHVGIMFLLRLKHDDVAQHMRQKEFRRGVRGGKLTSTFRTQEDIITNLEDLDLEPWSRHLIENVGELRT
jgi:predicted NUDIX family phosphoesterase